MRKIIEEQYHSYESRGVAWRGTELPKNVRIKTIWWCLVCAYEWKTTYASIKQGSGCPSCARKARITEEGYRSFEDRQVRWAGDALPKSTKAATLWNCLICGHEWKTNYNCIHQGGGCPKCAGQARKVSKDYHVLAGKKDVLWTGKFPQNTRAKTEWACKKGHVWETTHNSLSRALGGCPRCMSTYNGKMASSQQVAISEMLDGILNYKQDRIFIDVALLDKRIAIEYDSWYFHGATEQKDKKRRRQLLNDGWKVITIRSKMLVPERGVLLQAIRDVQDEGFVLITLEDWGKGDVFRGRKSV